MHQGIHHIYKDLRSDAHLWWNSFSSNTFFGSKLTMWSETEWPRRMRLNLEIILGLFSNAIGDQLQKPSRNILDFRCSYIQETLLKWESTLKERTTQIWGFILNMNICLTCVLIILGLDILPRPVTIPCLTRDQKMVGNIDHRFKLTH